MPVHNAAYKSIRSDIKKRSRNERVNSELKTRTKKLEDLISLGKKDEAAKYFKLVCAKYSKAASKGIVHKKTASRKISRLAKRINAIKQ